jgi:hypothetical protein
MKVAWFKDPDGNILNIVNMWPNGSIYQANILSFLVLSPKNFIYNTMKTKRKQYDILLIVK